MMASPDMLVTEVNGKEIEGLKEEQSNIKAKIDNLQESVSDMANTVLHPILPKDSPSISYKVLENTLDDVAGNRNGDEPQNHVLKQTLDDHPDFKGKLGEVTSTIKHLEKRWSNLDKAICSIANTVNNLDQYGRLYNLVLRKVVGVPYKAKGFLFSSYVVQLLNNLFYGHLFRPVTMWDIDKSHPLFKESDGSYAIIIRFTNRDMRDDIFYKRRLLADTNTGITLTENLTSANLKLLRDSKEKLSKLAVWSEQGVIYADVNGRKKPIKDHATLSNIAENFPDAVSTHVRRKKTPHTEQANSNTNDNEHQTDIVYGADLTAIQTWPTLLQAINYQEMKGPGNGKNQYPNNTAHNQYPNNFYQDNHNHGYRGRGRRGTRGRGGN